MQGMEDELKALRPRSDVRFFWPNYEQFYALGSRKDFNARLTGQLVGTARLWIKLVDTTLRKKANISRASWEMLFTIATGARPVTMSDIAARHGIQWPTIVRLVNKLEADGLIRVFDNPADGRSRLVDLVEAGWQKVEESQSIVDALRQSILAEFDQAQIKAMLESLERLDRAIVKQDAGNPKK